MANETNPGYLVQLQNPEGDNVYPVVTAEGIMNKDGSKFDPSTMLSDVGNLHVWCRTSTTSSEIPAGYTLADPIENVSTVNLGRLSYDAAYFGFAKTIKVYDNGYVPLDGRHYWIWYYQYDNVMQTVSAAHFMSASGSDSVNLTLGEIPGNFVYFYGSSTSWYDKSIDINQWYYVPKDAVVTVPSHKEDDTWVHFSKLQKVVSHPRIPAGTNTTYLAAKNRDAYTEGKFTDPVNYSISYVGMLGDGTRIQTKSYIGTGTYGNANAIKFTFDFVPKVVFVQNTSTYYYHMTVVYGMLGAVMYERYNTLTNVNWKDNTVSWYSESSALEQLNESKITYKVVAIG